MKIPKEYPKTALLVIDVQQGLFRKATPIYRSEVLLENINLVTHGCVRATCLGARKLGYHVTLVSDAHSNYSDKSAQLIDEWHQKLEAQTLTLKSTAEVEFE